MKAPISEQKKLLKLQEIDIQIAKINHLIFSMPIEQEIKELDDKLNKIKQLSMLANMKIADIDQKLKTVNDNMQSIENRISVQRERSKQHGISHKEVQSMMSEIAQMEKRKANLEDQIINLMEENSSFEQKLEKIKKTNEKLNEKAIELENQKKVMTCEHEEKKQLLIEQRQELVSDICDELVSLYEDVKKKTGGVAVLAMEGSIVKGVSIEFSIAELDKIKKAPSDQIICSQDYDYILVRMDK